MTAWDLIGHDASAGRVRVVGGRTLYEAVEYDCSRGGRTVRLGVADGRCGRAVR